MTDFVYIIHVDGDEDRKAHIQQQLRGQAIEKFTFAPGHKLDFESIERLKEQGVFADSWYGRQGYGPLGHYGASLSHFQLWSSLPKNSPAVVLEDDVVLCDDFLARVQALSEQLELNLLNWHICMLGSYNKMPAKTIPLTGVTLFEPERRKGKNSGFYAYLLNSKFVGEIIDSLLPMNMPIDTMVKTTKAIRSYHVSEDLVRHDGSFGSKTGHPVRITARTPKIAPSTASTDFVYVYKHAPAQSDELRWSIRSIAQNFQGDYRIWVVGDPPGWYCGRKIATKAISRNRYSDSAHKLLLAANHDQISEKFVWMMDDIYFLRSFDIDDIDLPRTGRRWVTNPGLGTSWGGLRNNTIRLLLPRYGVVHDYATHMPHVVEKSKLQQMFVGYPEIKQGKLLWEIVYGALNWRNPHLLGSALCYLQRPQRSPSLITQQCRDALVLNNGPKAWNLHLRRFLMERFPQCTRFERAPISQPARLSDDTSIARIEMAGSDRERLIAKMMAGFDIADELSPMPAVNCPYLSATILRRIDGYPVHMCRMFGETTLDIDLGTRTCIGCPQGPECQPLTKLENEQQLVG